jgi:hypothetical protein
VDRGQYGGGGSGAAGGVVFYELPLRGEQQVPHPAFGQVRNDIVIPIVLPDWCGRDSQRACGNLRRTFIARGTAGSSPGLRPGSE